MQTLMARLDSAYERIDSRLDKSGECWTWPGAVSTSGYGKAAVKTGEGRKSVTVYVHRAMYIKHVGPIPDGYEVDHLCRNTLCARPSHLEAVTTKENARRRAATVTHCTHGHEYTPENTHTNPTTGKRHCRACGRDGAILRRGGHLDSPTRRGPYTR